MVVKRTDLIPAAAYFRMSSDKQEASIPAQRTEVYAYALKHGYRIVREYIDEGISGDDTEKRKGFLQLREDAQRGTEFKVVLCWDQDRFGRFDPIEGGFWIKPFRDAGVRLETIGQGRIDWNDFAGRMLYMIQQEAKHGFLKDLSRNVLRGQIAQAKLGNVTLGTPPYGYNIGDGKYRIDEPAAKVVRRIFAEYLRHDGTLRGVCNSLNADNIPSALGGKWLVCAVRLMLRNEKYAGDFVWGKTSKGRYHGNSNGEIAQRNKKQKTEKSEPIIVRDNHEPIIDRETFNDVQAKLLARKMVRPGRRNPDYHLGGILFCGNCGHGMIGETRNYKTVRYPVYTCAGYHMGGRSVCTKNTVREGQLTKAVVNAITGRMLTPENLDKIKAELMKRRPKQVASDATAGIKTRLAELDRMIANGAERLLSVSDKLAPVIGRRLEAMQQERDELAAKLTAKPEHAATGFTEAQIDAVIVKLANLCETFRKAPKGPAHKLLRELIARIEVAFTVLPAGKYTKTEFKSGTVFFRPDKNRPESIGILPGVPAEDGRGGESAEAVQIGNVGHG